MIVHKGKMNPSTAQLPTTLYHVRSTRAVQVPLPLPLSPSVPSPISSLAPLTPTPSLLNSNYL
jgi:hypothetical protein